VTLLRSSLRISGGGLLELFTAAAAGSIASGRHADALQKAERFLRSLTVAAAQPAAATIGLIFAGALSAFFDQDR
jgi:hypothetical protein